MADLSLDAYIAQSGTSYGNKNIRAGGIGSRLGAKNPRGGMHGRGGGGRGGRGASLVGRGGFNASTPQFSVVGLGKARGLFDARQKLSNPLKTAVQDARQKIRPKTVDARQMLETKKEQQAGLDVRSRIENNKARKVDARMKINSARQAKDPQAGTTIKITPPGTSFKKITPPGSSTSQGLNLILSQGSLTKTILTNMVQNPIQPAKLTLKTISGPARPLRAKRDSQPEDMGPLTRTVENSFSGPVRQAPNTQAWQPSVQQSHTVVRPQSAPTSNLVITKRNTGPLRSPSQRLQQSPRSATSVQQSQRMSRGGMQQSTSRNTINMRGIRSASSEQWTGTESTLRSSAGSGGRGGSIMSTMVRLKNDVYEDDEEDMEMGEHHGGYRHSVPQSRTSQTPPVQPTTVWEAIQSVTTKRTSEAHAPRATKVPVTDTVSPLQGYRVLVTNLHPVVSQDDIIELFGAVGALKKAHLIKPGTAEVVFVTKEEALAACRKYHLRELDSLPMRLMLTTRGGGPEAGTPQRTNVTQPGAAAPPPQQPAPGGPLKLGQLEVSSKASSMSVDPTLIHKALFKTQNRDEGPTRFVCFTVKI